MSGKLNIASALLFIFGAWMLLEGLMMLFWTEGYLEMWIGMMNVEFRPPDISAIADCSDELLAFIWFAVHGYGFSMLFGGLSFCFVSLFPFRRGEKWAWYAMLVAGGVMSCGMLLGSYIGMTGNLPFAATFVIIWLIGLVLPAKEILG